MTKKQPKPQRQTFWILLVISALIVSLFYWYSTSNAPSADEAALSDAAAETSAQPACAANFVLALDTTTFMRNKIGNDTRLQAEVAAAKALLDHIDAVNVKNPEGVRARVGLATVSPNTALYTLTHDTAGIRTYIDSLTAKGNVDDGNTLTSMLKAADGIARPNNAEITKGTAYIVLISAARNNEEDSNDERTATQTASNIKEKNVIIEGFGFKLLDEVDSTGKFTAGAPENIVPNVTSGDARYHTINTTAGGVTAMKTFAEAACPRTGVPPVATCSSNLDLAYLVENSSAFNNSDGRVELAEGIAAKLQAKLRADDRAGTFTFSYASPTKAEVVKQGFTTETLKAVAAVKALKYNANTNLDQGVARANAFIRAEQTIEDGKVRPTVVVVLTTPNSDITQTGIDRAQRDFEKYGIRYFVAQIGQEDANHFAKLDKLAKAAGGKAFDLRASGTKAEREERAQLMADSIFIEIDASTANCVEVTLSTDKKSLKEGQTVQASYLVTNNSRAGITPKITQPLPAGLKQVVNGAPVAGPITLEVGPLASGKSIIKTVNLIAAN